MRVGRNISQALAKASELGASKVISFGFQPAALMPWLSNMGGLANLIMSQGKAHTKEEGKHTMGIGSPLKLCRRWLHTRAATAKHIQNTVRGKEM